MQSSITDQVEKPTQPTIVAERCVHSRVTQASCQACVDACPTNAWVMDDESLGIDTELCDGCGLCASVCPQGVINAQPEDWSRTFENRSSVLLACEKAGMARDNVIIPCIHALGLQQLLRLYIGGTRALLVVTGDCGSCIRNMVSGFPVLLTRLNGLLKSRQLSAITLQMTDREHCKPESYIGAHSPVGSTFTRRAFFSKVTTGAMSLHRELAGLVEKSTFIPPGKLLPRNRLSDPVPFAPRIDVTKCNGCDTCVDLCPQQAIESCSDSAEALQYRLNAENCSGCGLCVDVCNQDAVSVDRWKSQVQFLLSLKVYRCVACGAPFHLPAIREHSSELCAVCSRNNHASGLFQVMDQV